MRRIMQASGAEVIHLGPQPLGRRDRRLRDPGGRAGHRHHVVPGRPRRVLQVHDRPAARARRATSRSSAAAAAPSCPSEIEELHAYGVARIYSPDDGRAMGLQGMIDDLLRAVRLREARRRRSTPRVARARRARRRRRSAALITVAENYPRGRRRAARRRSRRCAAARAGARARHHRHRRRGQVEPRRRAGAPLPRRLPRQDDRRALGRSVEAQDRRRAARRPHPHERDRRSARLHALARDAAVEPRAVASTCASRSRSAARRGFDLIIVETSGIGQSDTEITEHADVSLYVMTAEYGAATQLEKIDMLDFADVDRDQQVRQARLARCAARRAQAVASATTTRSPPPTTTLPVYGTIASQFNDPGHEPALPRAHGR